MSNGRLAVLPLCPDDAVADHPEEIGDLPYVLPESQWGRSPDDAAESDGTWGLGAESTPGSRAAASPRERPPLVTPPPISVAVLESRHGSVGMRPRAPREETRALDETVEPPFRSTLGRDCVVARGAPSIPLCLRAPSRRARSTRLTLYGPQ